MLLLIKYLIFMKPVKADLYLRMVKNKRILITEVKDKGQNMWFYKGSNTVHTHV